MNIKYALIGASITFFFLITAPYFGNAKGYDNTSSLKVISRVNTNDLLRLTNIERTKRGLKKLTLDPDLMKSATDKAHDMETRKYWAHFAPDGTTPWSFIMRDGYNYEYAGENLAKNYYSSEKIIQGWMNSPEHRENLMRPEFENVGFGIVQGDLGGKDDTKETILVVAHYGNRLKSQD